MKPNNMHEAYKEATRKKHQVTKAGKLWLLVPEHLPDELVAPQTFGSKKDLFEAIGKLPEVTVEERLADDEALAKKLGLIEEGKENEEHVSD